MAFELGGTIVPALLFIGGSLCISDTPNSMIARGKNVEAKEKLREIRVVHKVDEEYNDILYAVNESQKLVQDPWISNLCKMRFGDDASLASACVDHWQSELFVDNNRSGTGRSVREKDVI